ncbi:MAG: hypothetical protein QOF85_1313 [Solirubrobacterales bacterium]|nr:hypothetical protein [Solirubrobacterales bacterium]
MQGAGNGGTVIAKVAVTDSVGNTVSTLGSGRAVKVTTNSGARSSATLTASK